MTPQNEETKSGLSAHEPSGAPSAPDADRACCEQAPLQRSRRSGGLAFLAFLMAAAALFFALSERFSPKEEAITSINQMITNSVVPEMKRSRERDVLDSLYELKQVSIVLEKLKETSRNPEVKAQVDQIRKQIEDLSVKMFVHE
ncbi:MAG: hypothetical protein AB1921_07220 [Thermodesulfobacteriota bacterium]